MMALGIRCEAALLHRLIDYFRLDWEAVLGNGQALKIVIRGAIDCCPWPFDNRRDRSGEGG